MMRPKPLYAGLNFERDLRFRSIGFSQVVDVDANPWRQISALPRSCSARLRLYQTPRPLKSLTSRA